MKPTAHGGDWASYETEYGRESRDFSMNVNPLGVPEGVALAVAEASKKADRYPDPECRRLRSALSAFEDVSADWIFCGNGAADIIYRIAFGAHSGAILFSPTFSEYAKATEACGSGTISIPLDRGSGFRVTEEALGRMKDALEQMKAESSPIVFLCEPNNPTGLTTDRRILEKILEVCSEAGALLVIDECFNGFLDDPDSHTMKEHLKDHPDLIILKAFTKIYGMAGVRLGYCLCSDRERLSRITEMGQPWSVSYLAEEAGLAALREDDYLRRSKEIVKQERVWLRNELEKLGIKHIYGEANYLLFDWPDECVDHVREEACAGGGRDIVTSLREKGILIRDCSNFDGLDEGWYRIAVRTHEENMILVDALAEERKERFRSRSGGRDE